MDFWLKALGSTDDPLNDDWRRDREGLFLRGVTFARQPSVKTGDGVVFYATGTGRIFACGSALSYPYRQDGDTKWEWRVDMRMTHGVPYLHNGVPLERLNSDGRDHRIRIKRRSHVRLTEPEFEAACQLIPTLDVSTQGA